jgi:hypothetical protein
MGSNPGPHSHKINHSATTLHSLVRKLKTAHIVKEELSKSIFHKLRPIGQKGKTSVSLFSIDATFIEIPDQSLMASPCGSHHY